MSEFQELIKSFAKSRNYVRDFLIYGFKSRDDFSVKSGRTYDNERRRIECWLSGYIRSDYSFQGKTVFLAMDSSLLGVNPLYRAWKAKSFTANDIVLHFLFLDLFRAGGSYTADEMADRLLSDYQVLFESQLVRKKANEYVKEGILMSRKEGRKLLYFAVPGAETAIPDILPKLLDAVRFCQLSMPLGVVGSMILDQSRADNEIFVVKHGYYGFTLEDEILFLLLRAVREKCFVTLINRTNKMAKDEAIRLVPLKIFVSTRTGRRFLCGYHAGRKRFSTLRLDHIQSVKVQEPFPDYDFYREKLAKNIPRCFGVSFGSSHAMDTVRLTLKIREGAEDYILSRLEREGHGGRITRTEENVYTYELSVFDGNEMMPWIKTFIGRIIRFESNNEYLVKKFYGDIRTMAKMYEIQERV
ncbi:MAG TPA: hypothetical protein DD414_06880 [Lachnospiraceae bacterium]|nr:hypothetical protein [Lachnospiraceae bacterium]